MTLLRIPSRVQPPASPPFMAGSRSVSQHFKTRVLRVVGRWHRFLVKYMKFEEEKISGTIWDQPASYKDNIALPNRNWIPKKAEHKKYV